MYATDTHSFLWFLTNDGRLGTQAKEIFNACDKGETIIFIPSIVLMESLVICEDKRVKLEFTEVLQKLENSFNYVVYPLDTDVVLECSKIEKIRDPHDRIIISTARLLNAKVITKDDKIVKSGLVETVF
ncbi:MAG: PIN domain-containing protein [Candidatus Aenigmarchaeota archaeon]|nr:PIN domain-containing protein [Candidatus Aenigmarchaeota archaeon]